MLKIGKDVANVLTDRYFAQLTSTRLIRLVYINYLMLIIVYCLQKLQIMKRIVSEINSNVSDLLSMRLFLMEINIR